MLQNILHLDISVEVEETSPEQPLSTLGVACLGRALWADRAWTALCRDSCRLAASSPSQTLALFTA